MDYEQQENLERVSLRIAAAVKQFIRERLARQNHQFFANELRNYVTAMTGVNAPGSADRVLRDLRQKRQLDYRVVSRHESLYEALSVLEPSGSPESEPGEPEPDLPLAVETVADLGTMVPKSENDMELTVEEKIAIQNELAECEAIIERGHETFMKVAGAVLRIRDKRLYRLDYSTFEEYCRKRWNWTRRNVDYQIAAAETAQSLGTNVPNKDDQRNLRTIVLKPENNVSDQRRGIVMPKNEWQVRPLVGLPPEVQREVWREAVRTAPNGKITGRLVREIVEARSRKRSTGRPKKAEEPDEAAYVRWFFKEFMRRRKEADLANSKRSWNPDAICKVDLINILVWVETELQTYLNGRSVDRREKAVKRPRQGDGATNDYKNESRNGPVNAGTRAAI